MSLVKVEKIIYLFVAASPGALKIFVLAAIGYFSRGFVQDEVANDLAFITFMTMLTAIGAGTQLLHVIPKDSQAGLVALQIFKGAVFDLSIYIFCICLALLAADSFYNFFVRSWESILLLFVSSFYWLFRHLYLARTQLLSLVLLEVFVWGISFFGFSVLYFFSELNSSNVLLVLSFAFGLSILFPSLSLVKVRARKVNLRGDAFSVGLSNMVSGGVASLAPTVCYHVGEAALTGAVGMIVNIASMTLTAVRAFLIKKIPVLSEGISSLKALELIDLIWSTQKTVNLIAFASFFVVQPIALVVIYFSGGVYDFYKVLLYIFLVSLFICIPQLSAVNSVLINYVGLSKAMLLINSIHALFVITITGLFYFYEWAGHVVFVVFLVSAIFLYIFRNFAVSKLVMRTVRLMCL